MGRSPWASKFNQGRCGMEKERRRKRDINVKLGADFLYQKPQ